MIIPKAVQPVSSVASHYNELDQFYRDIWGYHVHHGYWETGVETPEEAATALCELVASRLSLTPGERLCDIGCGYGETARIFASRYGTDVTGFTISKRQFEIAENQSARGVSIRLCDWLDNGLPACSFDCAYAIESSEHIEDKEKFFAEAYRVLKPGGRLAVCAWLAASDASHWQKHHLLEPICRQGRLASMGTQEDYAGLSVKAGFEVISVEDVSANVARTWTICLRRLAMKSLLDRRYAAFLLGRGKENKVFAATLLLIIAAYRARAMRYGVFVFSKPSKAQPGHGYVSTRTDVLTPSRAQE